MCFGSKKEPEGEDEGARRNKEIEKVLQEDKKRVAREVKILLLGMFGYYPINNPRADFFNRKAPVRAASLQC